MRSLSYSDEIEPQGDRRALALAAAAEVLDAHSDPACLGPGLPERLREVYTEGECELLADALHALTKWPVVVVGDAGGVVGWVHAGVQSPTGQILDADGCHDPSDWLTAWAPWVDAYGDVLEGYDPELVDVIPRPAPTRSTQLG